MDFPIGHRPFSVPARRRWRRLSPNAQGAFWMVLAGTGFTLNGLLVHWWRWPPLSGAPGRRRSGPSTR